MALRCCKDSVAMWAIAHDEPLKGQYVPCRWCSDGYGLYDGERWFYLTLRQLKDRIAESEAHIASPEFQRAKAEWKDGK